MGSKGRRENNIRPADRNTQMPSGTLGIASAQANARKNAPPTRRRQWIPNTAHRSARGSENTFREKIRKGSDVPKITARLP